MARRSLLKMYNKMLDNMEGVQSTSSGHGLGNLHHATSKISSVDNPDDINKCMSDMGVGNKRYDSDISLCQRSDNRRSMSQQPLIMDSQPYIPPKFHVRRKEELPSVTPHWSSNNGLELKESVAVHLADYNATENYNRHGSAISKRGKSPRVKTIPKTELGPYTPPQFFFTPQKYMEASKKEEVLINVDNRIPPSLQSWAKQNNKQDRSNREMESFKNVELENDTYYNPVREPNRNEPIKRYENKKTNISAQSFNDYYKPVEQPPKPKKPSTPVSCPQIVKVSKSKSKESKPVLKSPKMRAMYNETRINEESRYLGNLKSYKKLYEKAKWKETHANYAAQTYGNESWKTTVGRNLPVNNKKSSNDEASKFVYGNDNWKKTLVQPPQEKPKNPPKIKEQPPPINKKSIYGNESWRSLPTNNMKTQTEEIPEPISAKISQQIKDDNTWEVMNPKLKKEQENKDIISSYYKEKAVNLNKRQDTQNEEVKQTNNESNIWNDIEPFLPSFLSTSSTKDLKNLPSQTSVIAEAPIKQEVKEKVSLKSEASTNLLKDLDEKPVAKKKIIIRSSRAPLCPLKPKEPETISLFKHFQARSKHLRKQHSLLEKKKANCGGKTLKGNRQLSAIRGGNYNTKPYIDESEVKPKEKDTSYAPGTVCDIDDDGFKLSHSTEAFAFLQGEKYGGSENMFGGYQNLFNR